MHPRKEASLSRRRMVLDDTSIPYDDSKSTFSCLELLNGSALEARMTRLSSLTVVLQGLGLWVHYLRFQIYQNVSLHYKLFP